MIMLATLVCAFATAAAAQAGAKTEPTMEHGCIAVGSGLSRVAATVANPQDCCTGRMACSQYLSTTVVVRPDRPQRT
jgi:hypothetical protein